MNDTEDYIEIPISENPYDNEWFLYCAKRLDMEVKIKGGFYRVGWSNPFDLYELGRQVAVNPNKREFKTNYGLMKDGTSYTSKNSNQ